MSFAAIFIAMLCSNHALAAYVKESDLRHPPQNISPNEIRQWVSDAVYRVNPELKVRLLQTSDWANYINNNHFVSLEAEGVPPGYQFNYSWDPVTGPKAHLPVAEVTETGEFMFWTDKCNFSVMGRDACRELIEAITRHEARHYAQWKRQAFASMKEINPNRPPKSPPLSLSQMAKTNGAVVAFFRTWADEAHYQCREVEVYVDQIHAREIPGSELPVRLKALLNYTLGCSKSRWAREFSPNLAAAKVILQQNSQKTIFRK